MTLQKKPGLTLRAPAKRVKMWEWLCINEVLKGENITVTNITVTNIPVNENEVSKCFNVLLNMTTSDTRNIG